MPPTPRIGTVFAGFRIEALRGRGGMSVVYRAENLHLGNVVALKLLTPELAEDESFRERFVRESRTAASILHPHIIPIYDAGDEEGVLYIAMRYVDGPDLKVVARDGEGLPIGRVLRIGTQVASALDAAHERGLIHRDVKPANILLESGPAQEDHAYLADFGLTKNVESHSGITGTGHFVGTIDYMAPEQIEGRQVDAAVDVYALGCVLFECLAGSPPYRRESDVAVLWAHMRDEPPPLSEVRPGLPAAVDDVLADALAKDPGARPESCGELLDALAGALAGGATGTAAQPSRQTVSARTRRTARMARPGRGWKRAVVPGLVGLALGAGIASAVLLTTRNASTKLVAHTTTLRLKTSFLQPLIPVAVRRSCKRAPKLTPDYYESFACRPGHGVDTVQYNLVRGQILMKQHFLKRLRVEGFTSFGGAFTSSGDCSIGENAVQYWVVRNKKGGHDQASSGTPASEIKGAVLCHHDRNRYWIEWTDNRYNVFSVASGPSGIRLYDWWATRAGPAA
jgi:serine/threonine-protein kinase